MPLSSDIKFQKALALAASASNSYEAEAAELAARRLMERYSIDPLSIPDISLYDRTNFAGNYLLVKLRAESFAAKPVIERAKSKANTKRIFDHIPFNINGFSSTIKHRRKSPEKRATRTLSEEEKEQVRDEMRQGISSKIIRKKWGLSHGQTSGLRDRLGTLPPTA